VTGACGIECERCPIYIAAHDADYAEELAQQWRRDGHSEAKADWFRCEGCHGADEVVWGDDCAIRECCKTSRGLDNCSRCEVFPCDTINEFANDGIPHHREAVESLRQRAKND